MWNLHSSQESLLFPWSAGSLEQLLEIWKEKLKNWAQHGAISRAATDALALKGEPEVLQTLVSQWAAGDFSGLPPVVLLPVSSMPGAAGAYASSTRTIYLNQDWLQGASTEQALAVLTEELGHHLDGRLNTTDTPGDEGELFAALLLGVGGVSGEQRDVLLGEDDHGSVLVSGQELQVERAAQVVSTPISVSFSGRTSSEFRNNAAFAALRGDGSVVTWGRLSSGGDSSGVASQLRSGVQQIFSTDGGFAALKSDGSVVTWGEASIGSNSSGVDFDGPSNTLKVTQIFSTLYAFAALRSDGSVVTWGLPGNGGDSSGAESQLRSGVQKIFSNEGAFAALKSDGSVVTWGHSPYGGDSSGVASQLSSGVKEIFSTVSAFAALKSDGSVVTWGRPSEDGGDSSGVASELRSGVQRIFSNSYAFAALKSDGSVVTWGHSPYGGDSSGVASQLRSGVQRIFSNFYAFAALKSDGSVVTWGNPFFSGDSSGVASQLRSGVQQIFSTDSAFAALKSDGSVVTWGDPSSGGNSSGVSSQLRSGVQQIFSTDGAFAALKSDGSVVTWGSQVGGDISGVASRLRSGVRQIFSTDQAFAALKSDGSVVTWGLSSSGGDSSGVANQLTNVAAFANPFTDDRLFPSNISLSLTQVSVPEDGPGNLTYTFTRTGATSSPLTVSYTVGGSATPGTDYTMVGGTGTTTLRSVTFAANSSTTSVMVDPTVDQIQELDETITLTLSAGTGYVLASQSAATGRVMNDDRIGTAKKNTLVGTPIREYMNGMEGQDHLTGGSGPDVFGFWNRHSTLTSPDRITDFRFGSDKIDLLSSTGAALPAPTGFSRASTNTTARTLSELAAAVFRDANGAARGNQALGANKAALVVATRTPIKGTYLVINDSTSGRNNTSDLLINLTGHSGTLPGLGSIPVGTVFL